MRYPTRIALLWLVIGLQTGHAAERYALHNSVSTRASASHWLRAADADEILQMSLTLRLRHMEQLAALIAAQQDPASPEYRRWLTPDEFAARFAPSPERHAAVVDWLQREGFAVHPQVSGAR